MLSKSSLFFSTSLLSKSWNITPSRKVLNTNNEIRKMVQFDISQKNPNKDFISLSIGDPTIFGNLPIADGIHEEVCRITMEKKNDGYAHSAGNVNAREAIAKSYSIPEKQKNFKAEDVLLTFGCSQALDFSFDFFCNPGENILIPKPGFPLYNTLLSSKGLLANYYNLKPEKNWEVDLTQMENTINKRTRAILINNPSNPCGSVYSEQHLKDIIKIAEKYHLPIIADEVYNNVLQPGTKFVPIYSLTDEVPVITTGAVSKQFIVPGWRLGWALLRDEKNHIKQFRDGFERLSTLTLGPNTLVQAALPKLLETSQQYFDKLNNTLHKNMKALVNIVDEIDEIDVVGEPKGALYVMLRINIEKFDPKSGIINDITFMKKLLNEESVLILAATAFGCPNHLRVVFCAPEEKIEEAFNRIKGFCKRHRKKE